MEFDLDSLKNGMILGSKDQRLGLVDRVATGQRELFTLLSAQTQVRDSSGIYYIK